MGVLSGVCLLNYAYETMFRAFALAPGDDRVIRAVQIMAEKTGIYGMLGGQSVDVENDGKPITKEMLDYIYEHKTSALIEASMMTGAVLAGADAEETAAVEKAASYIGLAFQGYLCDPVRYGRSFPSGIGSVGEGGFAAGGIKQKK